jgi:hypothetical protein
VNGGRVDLRAVKGEDVVYGEIETGDERELLRSLLRLRAFGDCRCHLNVFAQLAPRAQSMLAACCESPPK